MDPKIIPILVVFATVSANLIFALTGVTHTLSCTVAEAGENLVATVHAAVIPVLAP